jgi:probable phosphoglycerate mutase
VHLLLIRHGQTPSNVQGLLDTAHPGPGLTKLGSRQAAQIPSALAGRPIHGIYVSTLIRTHLTAAPLSLDRAIHVVQLPGIHEIEAGDIEKRSDRDSVRTYLETVFAWGYGDLDVRMPGGADGHAFFARFDADIRSIEERVGSGTAVVVSHGAAIRVWVAARSTNVRPPFAAEHEIANTGIIELEGTSDEGFVLRMWQGSPVGGPQLDDEAADGPAGEALSDVGADPTRFGDQT